MYYSFGYYLTSNFIFFFERKENLYDDPKITHMSTPYHVKEIQIYTQRKHICQILVGVREEITRRLNEFN